MSLKKAYNVKIQFRNRLCAGIPADPDVITHWLAAGGIQDDAILAEKIADKTIKEEELDKVLQQLTTTFLTNEKGEPCLEARCIKAALKQTAGVMGLNGMIPGLAEYLKEGSEITPELIPIAVSKEVIKALVRPCHPKPKGGGPVSSSFKRTHYVEKSAVSFQIQVIDRMGLAEEYKARKTVDKSEKTEDGTGKPTLRKKAEVTLKLLTDIFETMGDFTGLGGGRSQGEGKFDLVSIEEVISEK